MLIYLPDEFEYAQRLMLTKERPVIMPVLFPDLDWNKTKHVRLCLANTNGIKYVEVGVFV